jgi:endonuclease YncB( thermonuclease family)
VTEHVYRYRVQAVQRVVDGDTYWLCLDLGLRMAATVPVRLLGFDCPESRGPGKGERAAAASAVTAARAWLEARAGRLSARTEKDPDSFGRWLAEVVDDDGARLGDFLAEQELAARWPTRWREQFPNAAL